MTAEVAARTPPVQNNRGGEGGLSEEVKQRFSHLIINLSEEHLPPQYRRAGLNEAAGEPYIHIPQRPAPAARTSVRVPAPFFKENTGDEELPLSEKDTREPQTKLTVSRLIADIDPGIRGLQMCAEGLPLSPETWDPDFGFGKYLVSVSDFGRMFAVEIYPNPEMGGAEPALSVRKVAMRLNNTGTYSDSSISHGEFDRFRLDPGFCLLGADMKPSMLRVVGGEKIVIMPEDSPPALAGFFADRFSYVLRRATESLDAVDYPKLDIFASKSAMLETSGRTALRSALQSLDAAEYSAGF